MKESLSVIRDLSFAIGVCLYWLGWVYIHHHFYHFGVHIFSLEIPFYYFLIYSYHAIGHALWPPSGWLVLAVVVLLGLFCAPQMGHRLVKRYAESRLDITSGIRICCALLLSYVLFNLAEQSGVRSAERIASGKESQRVYLVFKDDAGKQLPADFLVANAKHGLILLLQTKDRYLVLRQDDSTGETHSHEISKNDVYLADIMVSERENN